MAELSTAESKKDDPKLTNWVSQSATKPSSLLSNSNLDISFNTNGSKAAEAVKPNGENLFLQTNKIPHPPPQSTRPLTTSTPARKMRLSSAVTKTQQQNQQPVLQPHRPYVGGGESSNEEDMQNSSKTLIDYSPFKNKKLSKPSTETNKPNIFQSSSMINENITDLIQALKSENNKSKTNPTEGIYSQRPPLSLKSDNLNKKGDTEETTNKTNVYSFSSKPKAVAGLNNKDNQHSILSTGSSYANKVYDYRKYASSSGTSKQNHVMNENSNPKFILSNTINLDENKNTANDLLDSIVKDSLNIDAEPRPVYDEVMDSFEANMLRELKAEMESSSTQGTGSKVSAKKPVNSPHLPKRSTGGDIEDMSGNQTPLSDDYNQTSEKYNFDAITSSIDDTTTSLSKKTVCPHFKSFLFRKFFYLKKNIY